MDRFRVAAVAVLGVLAATALVQARQESPAPTQAKFEYRVVRVWGNEAQIMTKALNEQAPEGSWDLVGTTSIVVPKDPLGHGFEMVYTFRRAK